jgi:Dehydrogenase E1 component
MRFEQPSTYPALPTYRVVDQNGAIVDKSFTPDLSNEAVVKLYRDMLTVSIMDLIMFDAQRQGRVSFYMVSAGEEAVCVGSSSALTKEDVIFCQYREQGVFQQRGYALSDFMNQLFANHKDSGKGRNMPVHYGSRELNIVSRGDYTSALETNCSPSRRRWRRNSPKPREQRMRSKSRECRIPQHRQGLLRLTSARVLLARATSMLL